MLLSKNQSLGVLGVSTGLLVVNAVAGRVLLKHVERMEADYANMHKLTGTLIRIANYQDKIITERVTQFDAFDKIAYEQMESELNETIKQIEALEKKRKPRSKL